MDFVIQVSKVIRTGMIQALCVFFFFFCAAGAVAAVEELHQRIQNNTRRHENHLQLCRVQKLLKGRKTKVLAAG